MTPSTIARLAGSTFFVYTASALFGATLFQGATKGYSAGERLLSIAQHAPEMRLVVVLSLLNCLAALVLAVTLYGLTRHRDADLATLALTCRVIEGALNALVAVGLLALLSVATQTVHASGAGAAAGNALGALLLQVKGWGELVSTPLFGVGSTLYAYLFFRSRIIPAALAWLGIVTSALLVVLSLAQLAGISMNPFASLAWMPVLAFELMLALWLLIKGAPGL